MKTNTSNTISIFGTRPVDSIYLPDIPYAVRLNCKDGGVFVGGYEPQHRKSNPDTKIDISIIKVSKYFGSLGKTNNALWLQLFFLPLANDVLPKNTICVSYLKKQSIAHLFNTVQNAMEYGEPGLGIFTLGFNREVGEKGVYYTVQFDWRQRKTEEEKAQLDLIVEFMRSGLDEQLVDFEGTRDMICVDGMSALQLQEMKQALLDKPQLAQLPATA